MKTIALIFVLTVLIALTAWSLLHNLPSLKHHLSLWKGNRAAKAQEKRAYAEHMRKNAPAHTPKKSLLPMVGTLFFESLYIILVVGSILIVGVVGLIVFVILCESSDHVVLVSIWATLCVFGSSIGYFLNKIANKK